MRWFNGELTYRELAQRATALALRLQPPVAAEARVGIYTDRSPEAVVALLAAAYVGAAYVPIGAGLPSERVQFMLNDARVDVVLASETSTTFDAGTREVIVIDAAETADGCRVGCHAEQLLYVLYTSGSTGLPKGVAVPQRGVLNLFLATKYGDLGVGDVVPQLAPLTFDASAFEIWGALLLGATLFLAPADVVEPWGIGEFIAASGATAAWLTSSVFNEIVDRNVGAIGGLRRLVVGGEKLSPKHVAAARRTHPRLKLVNGYGPTEATIFSAWYEVDHEPKRGTLVPIGKAIPGAQLVVVDDELRPVQMGVEGELCIAGVGLARGYESRPGLTADRFVANPFGDRGERLYRTGDVARELPSGDFEVRGRRDRQVKIRGHRVELEEIEAVLRELRGVDDAAVDTRMAPSGEQVLVAWVVSTLDSAAVAGALGRRLPWYMVPARVEIVASVPLNRHGKFDRSRLPAPRWPRGRHAIGRARTTEDAVAAAWECVLHLRDPGRSVNFFEAGGSSLRLAELKEELERAIDAEVSLVSLLEYPTIREFAAYLEATHDGTTVRVTSETSNGGQSDADDL